MSQRSEAARLLPLKRKQKGWSQNELGRQLEAALGTKVYRGTICRMEQGSVTPSLDQVFALEDLVGVNARLWTVSARRQGATS